jgi:uncharacterized membrane protein SirB2
MLICDRGLGIVQDSQRFVWPYNYQVSLNREHSKAVLPPSQYFVFVSGVWILLVFQTASVARNFAWEV